MQRKNQRTKERTRVQGFRLTEADELALTLLSNVMGFGKPDVVRLLIRQAAERFITEGDRHAGN